METDRRIRNAAKVNRRIHEITGDTRIGGRLILIESKRKAFVAIQG